MNPGESDEAGGQRKREDEPPAALDSLGRVMQCRVGITPLSQDLG